MMGRYSIKKLEQLSGIKAHTIRIWEKRNSLIQPQRTDTNIRFYSDGDLKKIINVSLLNSNGFKISRIVEMSDLEITQKVFQISDSKTDKSMNLNKINKSEIEKSIEEDFAHGLSGIKRLPRSARFGVYVAYMYYLALFRKIKHTPQEKVLRTRIRIANRQKATLLAYSFVKHQLNMI